MSFEIKRNALCISVRNGGEYGAFFAREWNSKRSDGSTEYGCELTIHSSFGTLGHTWSAMGMRAHKFFDKIEMDYLFGKLYGRSADRFDFDDTVKAMKSEILTERREGALDKDEARELFDEIVDLEHTTSSEYFILQAQGKEALAERWDHIYFPIQTKIRGDALRFYELLWPEFVAGLKAAYHEAHCEHCDGLKATMLGRMDQHEPSCPKYTTDVPY